VISLVKWGIPQWLKVHMQKSILYNFLIYILKEKIEIKKKTLEIIMSFATKKSMIIL
jgi:hypothetical protein